jgi:hypothetical protein
LGGEYKCCSPVEAEVSLLSKQPNDEEVNAAVRLLISREGDAHARSAAFDKVAAFRSSFAFPLCVVSKVLQKHTYSIDQAVSVYGRSKRMISILTKVQRLPRLKVTTLQDVAGCRAVMGDVEQAEELAARI